MGKEWKDKEELTGPITGGWPDFAIKLSNGDIEFYEVKSASGVLQTNQTEILTMLKKIGKVYVATKKKEGDDEFDTVPF